MKIHKLYTCVIYDLRCNIYLSTEKGDSKSAKGSSNESSFLTGGRGKKKGFSLEAHHSPPNALLKIVVSQ